MHATIVVGVDGSPPSERALAWAVDEAAAHGDDLLLVHAWAYPSIMAISYGGPTVPVFAQEDMEKVSNELVEQAADAARARAPALVVTTRLVQGHAAAALVEAARGARMLVVGSRGLGGFKGMLLGSISTSCVHHATCPIVIVPPE
jgi:nucleotide-binding universal stress UspA family protein